MFVGSSNSHPGGIPDLKKVAFWTTLPGGGGTEHVWQELARRMAGQGHQVFFSVFDIPENARFLEESREWRDGMMLRHRSKTLMMSVAGRLGVSLGNSNAALLKARPEALVINSDTHGWVTDEALTRSLATLSIPYVVIIHGSGGFFEDPVRDQARRLYAGARAIHFVSEYTRRMTERHLAMALPNAKVIRNPVHASIKKSDPPPYPATEDGLVLATVSRLNCYTKGHDFLFEALSDPRFRDHDFSVRIYGGGQHARYLDELIGYFGLQDTVRMMGHASDINQVWSEAHVHLLPSVTESAPLALVEAMLCGRASVATRVGGIPDWLDDGAEGFIAENANVWNLVPALEQALKNTDRLEEMGRRAREKALRMIGDPVIDLHESLLSLDGFL